MTNEPSFYPSIAPEEKKENMEEFSGGAIAGIIVGCVAFVGLLGGLVYYYGFNSPQENLFTGASSNREVDPSIN